MKFGIQTAPMNYSWKQLREIWVQADGLDFDSAWVFDHLLPLRGTDRTPTHDGWSILPALAEATERMEIGNMVSSNTFRHPALLAKMAVTLDHVSNGRVTIGLGSGYFEPEHSAYGIDFAPGRVRAERLDEALKVITGLLTEERFTFHGAHYAIEDAPFSPAPVQRPRPPILIGGRGPRFTLRTVARYADKWNLAGGSTAEDFAEVYAVLRERCAEIGRDPDEIEPNMAVIVFVNRQHKRALERARLLAARFGMDPDTVETAWVVGDPSAVADRIRGLEAVGVRHFVSTLVSGANDGDMGLFANSVMWN